MYKRLRSHRLWTGVLTLALAVAMAVVMVSPGFAYAKGPGKSKELDKFLDKALKNLKHNSSLSFCDLSEALWAIASIAKMKGYGIINGYDGGYFRPNSAVTQAEALAMIVRALDMEEEAQDIHKKFAGTYATSGYEYLSSVPNNTQWALGYILLAVEEGWVKVSEMNPSASASRAWVSMVMVRALGEDEAAQDEMGIKLPYKDAKAIPASMVGYVAVAVDLGLFQGYPEGNFQPNKAVTRAEMATIIDRYLSEELPTETSFKVTGIITSVSKGKLTVKTESGRSTTYEISSDALILVNNRPASRSDLRVGDEVEVVSNGEGVALLITVLDGTTAPTTSTVVGEIVSVSTVGNGRIVVENEDGDAQAIRLAADCTITYGTNSLDVDDLLEGDMVKVTVKNNLATAIKVTSRPDEGETVEGIITKITKSGSTTSIVVEDDGDKVTLRLHPDCEITYKTSLLAIKDLKTGDKVRCTVVNNRVVEIVIRARNQETQFGDVGGTIISISQSASEFVVTIDDGEDITSFEVPTDCEITYGDDELSRTSLRLGDEVRVDLNDDGEAVEIRILARAS